MNKLLEALNKIDFSVENVSSTKKSVGNRIDSLVKKTVCITGKIDGYSRSELESLLTKKFSAYVSKTVTNDLDYLIVGHTTNSPSKETSARRKGIEVVSGVDLLEYLESVSF